MFVIYAAKGTKKTAKYIYCINIMTLSRILTPVDMFSISSFLTRSYLAVYLLQINDADRMVFIILIASKG